LTAEEQEIARSNFYNKWEVVRAIYMPVDKETEEESGKPVRAGDDDLDIELSEIEDDDLEIKDDLDPE
jgi:hypothetical protein